MSLDVPRLCTAIATQGLDPDPVHPNHLYRYEGELAAAAGVVASDPMDIVNAKIRKLIDANWDRLTCTQVNFYPQHGNILKLAVARQANPVIDDMLTNWRVDLNQIDRADGRTVLDYIRFRATEAGEHSTFAVVLNRYYRRFRAAGAKHASELE